MPLLITMISLSHIYSCSIRYFTDFTVLVLHDPIACIHCTTELVTVRLANKLLDCHTSDVIGLQPQHSVALSNTY